MSDDAIAFNLDASHAPALSWTLLPGSWGTIVYRDNVAVATVAKGLTSFTDTGAQPGPHAWVVASLVPARTAKANGVIPVPTPPPPPPTGTLYGAYADNHPAGTDSSVNLANLQAFFNGFPLPAGKSVKLVGINTYSGNMGSGTFVPLNGVQPPQGDWIFLSLGMGDGTAYSATGTTLLAQCQALAPKYTALFQKCVSFVGPGRTKVRTGYEWTGNWSSTGVYPVGGVGAFVNYPPQDAHDAIAFVAGLAKAVDPGILIDFNGMGDGPNGMLDQWGQPVINRCPMNMVDIISSDTQIKQYGVAHVIPYIELAKANGKKWGVPECPPSPADPVNATSDITAMCNLVKGLPAFNRGDGSTYTAFEPAFEFTLFSSNDGGQIADIQDPSLSKYAPIWAQQLAA